MIGTRVCHAGVPAAGDRAVLPGAAGAEAFFRSRYMQVTLDSWSKAPGPARTADGHREGVMIAPQSARPDFGMLQRRMPWPSPPLLALAPVTLIAFDLLQIGTRKLTGNPFRQRRMLLGSLDLATAGAIVSPLFTGEEAPDVLAVSADRSYEGVVLKRPASPTAPADGPPTGSK